MKVLILYISLGLLTAMEASAQNKYDNSMKEALELWNNDQADQAANLFERIALAEKEKWLPYYYASLVKVIQSFPMTDPYTKEQQLNESQTLLDQAQDLKGDKAELLVLQAMLHTSRLTLDPGRYGQELSPVINEIYAEALKAAPDNPRVVLSKAEWDMGSARFFGKDPAAHCSELSRSLELFKKEEISPIIAPAWGEDRARSMVDRMCQEQ